MLELFWWVISSLDPTLTSTIGHDKLGHLGRDAVVNLLAVAIFVDLIFEGVVVFFVVSLGPAVLVSADRLLGISALLIDKNGQQRELADADQSK